MKKENQGKILNVASTGSFKPGPLMAVHYGIKAYVLSFTESIAAELKDSNITVTALCPGYTKTNFHKKAGMKRSNKFKYQKAMSPALVAKLGYNAMMKGKVIEIPGITFKLFTFILRILPRSFIRNSQLKVRKGDDF